MHWDTRFSEVICRCRIFSVRRDSNRSQSTGQEFDFFVIESADWVNIVPLTSDGRVVMVRQFRHGVRALTLEVPAGIVDPTDASPAVAAERELREETGYAARRVEPLGVVHPNPAIMTNHCHIFVARDVTPAGPPQWDGTEELEVVTVPLAAIPDLMRSGGVSNALTVTAFHLLALADSAPGA